MAERFVDVIYAEDIRAERTGQISLIGVFHGAVNLPRFPHIFPKFHCWLRIRTAKDDLFQKMKLVVSNGSEIISEVELSEDIIASQIPTVREAERSGIDEQTIELALQVVLSPLTCSSPGVIYLRVETEREVLSCRPLPIQLARTV